MDKLDRDIAMKCVKNGSLLDDIIREMYSISDEYLHSQVNLGCLKDDFRTMALCYLVDIVDAFQERVARVTEVGGDPHLVFLPKDF